MSDTPICWIRTLNGQPDWAEDCVSHDEDSLRFALPKAAECIRGEVYDVVPLALAAELAAYKDAAQRRMEERDEARNALSDSQLKLEKAEDAAMKTHQEVRASYDKAIADSWRAEVAKQTVYAEELRKALRDIRDEVEERVDVEDVPDTHNETRPNIFMRVHTMCEDALALKWDRVKEAMQEYRDAKAKANIAPSTETLQEREGIVGIPQEILQEAITALRTRGNRLVSADILPADWVDTLPERIERAVTASPSQGVGPWRDPAEIPPVEPGDLRHFVVAVQRKHDGKVYTFEAHYLNAYRLCGDFEDDDPTIDEEGTKPFTGWYDERHDEGEYDDSYHPLLTDGAVLRGWMPVPEFLMEGVDRG